MSIDNKKYDTVEIEILAQSDDGTKIDSLVITPQETPFGDVDLKQVFEKDVQETAHSYRIRFVPEMDWKPIIEDIRSIEGVQSTRTTQAYSGEFMCPTVTVTVEHFSVCSKLKQLITICTIIRRSDDICVLTILPDAYLFGTQPV
jgi:hypothetical protein